MSDHANNDKQSSSQSEQDLQQKRQAKTEKRRKQKAAQKARREASFAEFETEEYGVKKVWVDSLKFRPAKDQPFGIDFDCEYTTPILTKGGFCLLPLAEIEKGQAPCAVAVARYHPRLVGRIVRMVESYGLLYSTQANFDKLAAAGYTVQELTLPPVDTPWQEIFAQLAPDFCDPIKLGIGARALDTALMNKYGIVARKGTLPICIPSGDNAGVVVPLRSGGIITERFYRRFGREMLQRSAVFLDILEIVPKKIAEKAAASGIDLRIHEVPQGGLQIVIMPETHVAVAGKCYFPLIFQDPETRMFVTYSVFETLVRRKPLKDESVEIEQVAEVGSPEA